MARTEAFKRFVRQVLVGSAVATLVTGVATPPTQAQDAPVPLKELLINKDPLLREIFAKAPVDDVKGLAAKIKAEEITVRHRIRAVRYLATVDCVAYPEAKEMLVKMLHEDKWEPVRYEAAKALKTMFGTGVCAEKKRPERFGDWLTAWRRNNRRTSGKGERRYDYCPGCCDKDTLNALVKTAYEMNKRGNCFEPSLRVREMAVEAIKACGIPCKCGPYYGEGSDQEEMGPPPIEIATPEDPVEVKPKKKDEPTEVKPKKPSQDATDVPPSASRTPGKTPFRTAAFRNSAGQSRSRNDNVSNTASTNAPLPSLNGLCIVELAANRRVKANSQFRTVYRGRCYYFSSGDAKARFDAAPTKYAVAYGGYDPVHYAKSKSLLDGRMLCEYRGQLYCFATKANWETFQKDPQRYVVRKANAIPVRQVGHTRSK